MYKNGKRAVVNWFRTLHCGCAVIALSFVGLPPAVAQTELVAVDAPWMFLSPVGAASDPGATMPNFDSQWFLPEFDTAGWVGPVSGPLEYGGVDALTDMTTVNFLNEPMEGDRYTNYFRHEFVVPEDATGIGLDLLVDDGAIFYLDGEELLRWNCCADESGNDVDDYLSFSRAGGNEDRFRTVYVADELQAGSHLLAVSVHQDDAVSSDLGLGLRVLSGVSPPPPPNPNAIRSGVDTFISESGQDGPDAFYGDSEEFEFDGEDGDPAGSNHGLLWFDVPQDRLDSLGDEGTATLKLYVSNRGEAASIFRVTSDWLSGSDGGNNITWNSFPNGPGVVPGQNALDAATANTGELASGDFVEFDVTADLQAWAAGDPNYGWAFVPDAVSTNGIRISSFESIDPPELLITPGHEANPQLQAGDSDEDFDFDQLDLVAVQVAGKYLSGQSATWSEGDWNGAPGGGQGSPPAGDGFFNQLDIIAAQLAGTYLTGPYAAVQSGGMENDGQTSLVYDSATGSLSVDAPAGIQLTSINIDSASDIFTGDAAQNLGGSFDNDADGNIFKATFGGSFGSIDLGNVATRGLSETFLLSDLSVVGSLQGGGDLGNVDLIYIPEPASILILIGTSLIVLARRRPLR